MFKIIFSWKGKPCSRHTSTRRTSLASRTCAEVVSAVSPLRVICGVCELCVKQVSVGPNSQPNLLYYEKYLTRRSVGVSFVYHSRVRDGRLLRWRPQFPLNHKVLANHHRNRFDGSSPTPSASGSHVALSITLSSPRSLACSELAPFPPGVYAAFASAPFHPCAARQRLLLRRIPFGHSHAEPVRWSRLETPALGTLGDRNALCHCFRKLLDRRRDLSFYPLIPGAGQSRPSGSGLFASPSSPTRHFDRSRPFLIRPDPAPSFRTKQADFFFRICSCNASACAERNLSSSSHFSSSAFEAYLPHCHNPRPWSAPSTSTSWPANPGSSTSA